MNFRSSVFSPVAHADAKSTTWCEARQAEDLSYLVVTMVVNPALLARPGLLARLSARRPDPSSVPASCVASIPALTAYEALEKIFEWERQQCENGAVIVDIGGGIDKRYSGIDHYFIHMACSRLVGPAYPRHVSDAVSAFSYSPDAR